MGAVREQPVGSQSWAAAALRMKCRIRELQAPQEGLLFGYCAIYPKLLLAMSLWL